MPHDQTNSSRAFSASPAGGINYSGGSPNNRVRSSEGGAQSMKTQRTWERILLPRLEKTQWTWNRIFLLCVAVFLFVDQLFIPASRNVDPGRSGEGILFLIVGFRAVSGRKLPISVVIAGTCLAALTSSANHGLLKSPSLAWTSLGILLMVFVMFWNRGDQLTSGHASRDDSSIPSSPDSKSTLKL